MLPFVFKFPGLQLTCPVINAAGRMNRRPFFAKPELCPGSVTAPPTRRGVTIQPV